MLVQQLGGSHGGLHALAGHGHGDSLAAAQNRDGDHSSLFALDHGRNLGDRAVLGRLSVHLDDHVPYLNTGFLRRAARLHGDDHQPGIVIRGLDRHANAHIGILRIIQKAGQLRGGDVIAPAVAHGIHHGIRGGILNFCLVRIPCKAGQNQVFQVLQLVVVGGCGDKEKRRAAGQSRHQHIGQDDQNFLFHFFRSFWVQQHD